MKTGQRVKYSAVWGTLLIKLFFGFFNQVPKKDEFDAFMECFYGALYCFCVLKPMDLPFL